MIIIGHPWIKSSRFRYAFSQEDIKQTQADDIVLLEPLSDSHGHARYCQANHIPYGVVVSTVEDAVLANALGASYAICEEDDALEIQPVAQAYLFDTRVLVLVYDPKKISKLAKEGIDGVLFAEAIY